LIKKELRQALKRSEDGIVRSNSGQSLDSLGKDSPSVSQQTSPKHSRTPKGSFPDDYGLSNIDKNEIIHKLVETQKLNVKEIDWQIAFIPNFGFLVWSYFFR